MTQYVEPDPQAAVQLVLAHLADVDQQRRIADVYTAADVAALCGGLVSLVFTIGLEHYGTPEALTAALRFMANAIELGDLQADPG